MFTISSWFLILGPANGMIAAMSETYTFDDPQAGPGQHGAAAGLSTDSITQALGYDMADRRIAILRGIAQSGSISQAARDVGVSYKAAWQAIDTLTNLAGVPLVERSVGGAGGGGAQVTAAGEALLRTALSVQRLRAEVLQRLQEQGEAAAPGAAPWPAQFGLLTSMRNQWSCTELRVESLGAQIRVWLRAAAEAGADWTLAARITPESYELLGLAPGAPVLALCKATAVKIWLGRERPETATQSINLWPAEVQHASWGSATVSEEAAASDEAVCRFHWGGQIVGFAPAMSGLAAQDQVWLEVPESAVVVGVCPP